MAWDTDHSIKLFDVLYIAGLTTHTATVLTAWLSPTIRRSSSWFMLIWSWLLVSVSYILIVGHQTGPEPAPALCLFQAMLIYGIRVLCSLYVGTFALQVYWSVQGATNGKKGLTRNQMIVVHAFPILVCLAMLVLVLVLGLKHPDDIARNDLGMFCHSISLYPARITAGVVICAMLTNIFFTARLYRVIRRYKGISAFEEKDPYFSPDVITRMMMLTCCPIMGLAISIPELMPSKPATDTASELLLATLPLIIGLIFGSQRDILHVWGSFVPYRGKNPLDVEIRPAAA